MKESDWMVVFLLEILLEIFAFYIYRLKGSRLNTKSEILPYCQLEQGETFLHHPSESGKVMQTLHIPKLFFALKILLPLSAQADLIRYLP